MSTLPAPLTRFVGREAELARAAALLSNGRLLTLTGPGGAGKTRLALQLASRLAAQFSEGVHFADLSPLSDGEFVWDQVAGALGVRAQGSKATLIRAVGDYLAERKALVVLDNCEHLVPAAAEVAAELLMAAPKVKLIATSREPLGVEGEVTWSLPPLTDEDGTELFGDRARQARPDFQLRAEDADAVRSICRRLGGLPLAIELAAARTRAFAPADIATGLRDRLDMLPSGPRSAPARQSTLEASFDWSYELLSDGERDLLRQCSVFAGGFDLESATAVCPAADLRVIAALVDRSLLLVQDEPLQSGPRYRMLEPIRQFAARRLEEAGGVDEIRTRHRDHFLTLAQAAEPQLSGPDEDRWRARLTVEMDNLRAALAWSRDVEDGESLARMVLALMWFWMWPGRIREFLMWLDAAAERADDLPIGLRAAVRNRQCLIPIFVPGANSIAELPARSQQALALARESGDTQEEAFALILQGFLAGLLGGSEASRPFMEQALPLARSVRSTGFGQFEATALSFFALLRLLQSGAEETRRLSEEAIAVATEHGDRHTQLLCMSLGGYVALAQGRLDDARRLHEAAVSRGRTTNDSNFLGSLLGLAWVSMFQGDFAAARASIAECLAAAQKAGTDSRSITSLDPQARTILGWMCLAEADAAQASETLATVIATTRPFIIQSYSAVALVPLARARMALGEASEAAAFLDDADELARKGRLTWILGRTALLRAEIRLAEGDLDGAESLAHEAIKLGREAGDQLGLVDDLELLGRLTAEQSSTKEAGRLLAAAESIRNKLGYARFPIDRGPYEAALSKVKQALSADDFTAARVEGAKLTPEEAIAYASRGRGERKRPSLGWASLTPSELDVVRLVGEHLSNPEIAARLFVSRATVKTHLVHIFTKLGIGSRSELVAKALKHGIPVQTIRRA